MPQGRPEDRLLLFGGAVSKLLPSLHWQRNDTETRVTAQSTCACEQTAEQQCHSMRL